MKTMGDLDIGLREALLRFGRAIEEYVDDVVEERLRSHGADREVPRLLTRNDIAQSLGVSLATIDRLTRDGLPCERVGRHRRYDLAAVRTWLAVRQPAARAEVRLLSRGGGKP